MSSGEQTAQSVGSLPRNHHESRAKGRLEEEIALYGRGTLLRPTILPHFDVLTSSGNPVNFPFRAFMKIQLVTGD